MRELEFRITEIHSVQDFKMPEWSEISHLPYVKVDISTECLGITGRSKQYLSPTMWEKSKLAGILILY